MKRKLLIGTMMCLMTASAEAQIYAGDTWAQFPTTDLYDTGVMNMRLRAMAETAAIRQKNYQYYSDQAIEAYKKQQWNYAISYVNQALSTQYYCGLLYYIRGYAYEQLGNLRAAKKDYKTGIKYDSTEAYQAMQALKARKKHKR